MIEFARAFFLFNGKLMPTSAFEQHFNQPQKYIYEVFRVQEGVPVFIEDHLDRLWHTAELEGVTLDFSPSDLLHDILQVVLANPKGDGNIKIVIRQSDDNVITTLIYFTPHLYPTAEQFKTGVPVGLFFAERNNPNAKVMDVALRSATDQVKSVESVYEVLLVDSDGFITEGSRSNVFFINNNLLITPPVETVLEGVTRKQIMKLCAEHGIDTREHKVHHSNLDGFDALFLSGTSRRVLPISKVDDMTFSTAIPVMHRMYELLEERVRNFLATKH
ncbi:MAG: aminotransferase class IV [Bacteroidales bacterium]|nr:aminotransferase class IV [Bacteroidales bacterium]MDZ4204481.1 aminotransferase class IV [Bacteroidales bacterium]